MCVNKTCMDACPGNCAVNNAVCYVENHEPKCACSRGYDGDPTVFNGCVPIGKPRRT